MDHSSIYPMLWLLRISLLMPDPGGADDFVELGVAGFPAQFADDFLGAGDENRGVSGAAGVDAPGAFPGDCPIRAICPAATSKLPAARFIPSKAVERLVIWDTRQCYRPECRILEAKRG